MYLFSRASNRSKTDGISPKEGTVSSGGNSVRLRLQINLGPEERDAPLDARCWRLMEQLQHAFLARSFFSTDGEEHMLAV